MKKFVLTTISLSLSLSGCVHKTNSETGTEIFPLETQGQETAPAVLPLPKDRIVQPDIYLTDDAGKTEVLRDGRYTLVNISPEEGQKNLLDQSVTVDMLGKKRKSISTTVEQGLQATLRESGFSLCSAFNSPEPTLSTLFYLPLPRVHYQFGPMALRDAVQMLAGPGYEMTVNDVTRVICFKQRSDIPKVTSGEKQKIETTTTTVTEIIEE